MTILKLSILPILGLMLVACSEVEPNQNVTTNSRAILQDSRTIPHNVREQDDEKLLRYLAERSDLIVIGEVTETKFLVEPVKMKAEIEIAMREGRLPNGEVYISGNVYDVAVLEMIYKRPDISSHKTVRVYSLDNPFSLHPRLVPLMAKQKYLLFLSRAKEKDIVTELKIRHGDDSSQLEDVRVGDFFLVTERATAATRALKGNDSLIMVIKAITETLRSRPPAEFDAAALSKDYETAEKALDKAILRGDKPTIKRGLENPIFSIKKRTIDAILKMHEAYFVPDLITTLEKNQAEIVGGTETRLMKTELDVMIINALTKITEIKFTTSEQPTPKEIAKIISVSREWVKNNKFEN